MSNRTHRRFVVYKWYARPLEGDALTKYEKECSDSILHYNHLVDTMLTIFRSHPRAKAKRLWDMVPIAARRWYGIDRSEMDRRCSLMRNKATQLWKKGKFPTKEEMKAFRAACKSTSFRSLSCATREANGGQVDVAVQRFFRDPRARLSHREKGVHNDALGVVFRTATEGKRRSWSLVSQGETDARRQVFTLRVPKYGDCAIKTLVDRPIPPEAKVVAAKIVREFRGPLPQRWWVNVTLELPMSEVIPERILGTVTIHPHRQHVCVAVDEQTGEVTTLDLDERMPHQQEALEGPGRYGMRERRLRLHELKMKERTVRANTVWTRLASMDPQDRPMLPARKNPDTLRAYCDTWIIKCPENLHCKRTLNECFDKTTKEYACWYHADVHDHAHGLGATRSGQRSRLDLYRTFARGLERRYTHVRIPKPGGKSENPIAAFHVLSACLKQAFGPYRTEEYKR